MSKVLRSLAAVTAVVLSVLTFVPNVAEAGVGNQTTPDIPVLLTVGDTNVPVSIVIGNNNFGGESGLTNTVCNWLDGAPCPTSVPGSLPGDPGINAIMSCGQLGLDQVCDPVGADPGVFSVSSTGSGVAGTACAGQVFDIVQTETVFGTLRFTPQAPPTNVTIAPTNTCQINFTVDVVKMPTIDESAGTAGVQTVFIADNTQWTLGQAGFLANSARGTDNSTIQKKTPSITTTASTAGTLGATTLTDTANVFGRAFPDATSTVSFRLYGPDDPTCSGTPVFEDLANAYPQTGGPITSDPYTPTQAGTHRWVATYNGDSNNVAVSGTCGDPAETVEVAKATPTIVTAASSTVALGQGQLTDSAVVNGRVNPVAGGTIDFRLYGPTDPTCTAAPVFESLGVVYPAAGGSVPSAAYTPTSPGTYRWVATYSGDANNNGAQGTCGDTTENTTVDKATPVLATTASATTALGGTVTDAATVTGRFQPQASTIDFRLYGPNDATCSSAPVFQSLGVAYPAAGGSVSSLAFTPSQPGLYRWVATYNGDANNNQVVGTCGEESENVRVFAGTPTIVTNASANVFVGDGVPLTDVATVLGRVSPLAGATIDFRLYGPNDATCSGTPVFTSLGVPYPVAGGAVSSGAFIPTVAGTYRWVASYSGDVNNASATGVCGDPAETVVVAPTPDIGTELPETGPGDVRALLWTGSASVLLGGVLLGFTSRRRRPYGSL